MPAKKRAASLAALSLLLGTAWGAAADPVTLVTPIVYGTHLPGLGEPALKLARRLKQRSGGALQLDLKQPGDGTKPHEILDEVSHGNVDAGFATASFWSGKLPAAALFSGFPFGPDAQGYVDWFDNGNGRKLYQDMYDEAGFNVHVLPCAFGGAETAGWFAKEIGSKDDLKGLRVRAFGLGGRVLKRLGAKPVLIRGGAVAEAFEKGKIDAAELYPPAVDQKQGPPNQATLIYVPGWHQPETVLELLVNKAKWNDLSAEHKGFIETACQETLQATLAETPRLQADALAALAKEGVRIEAWPHALEDAFRGAWNEVAKEEGERDSVFREVLDDLERFRAEHEKDLGAPASAAAAPARSP
jgi:TRAP-type mannitol/chloroaromatic compound transport system substrate-binding protein